MANGIPDQRQFAYLTSPQVRDLPDQSNTVLIQPVGAIEQHGPHLPLITDSAIATGIIGTALARLDPAIPAYALPPLHYGKSNEHLAFPGTIALSATTLLSTIMELGDSLYRAGFRKLILANGHGGQPQVLEIAATDLRSRHPDFWVFPWFVWRASQVYKDLLSVDERALALHAGDAETSLMLVLMGDRVDLSQATREWPRDRAPGSPIHPKGPLGFGWLTSDLSESGIIGDPTKATAAKGQQILDLLADAWVARITEVYHWR